MHKKILIGISFILLIMGISKVKALSLNCDNIIQNKFNKEDIVTLQKMLNSTTNCNLKLNGQMDDTLKECVIKFQNANNLDGDGIVGKLTCSKLKAVSIFKSRSWIVTIKNDAIIRKEPNNNSEIVRKVKLGKELVTFGKVNINGIIWYKVRGLGTKKSAYINSLDASDTIILIDISSQKLTYYKDSQKIVYTDVVTGFEKTHDTPIGIYELNPIYMTEDVALRGYNDDGTKYNSHVNYWMPFALDEQIGMHDANWRTEFGKSIYKNDGSHGCVNMPNSKAKAVYENIDGITTVMVKD